MRTPRLRIQSRRNMLAKISSCAIVGLEGAVIEVEVDSGRGLASFTLVGLPDAAVKESAERVRSAIRNSGLHFPTNRVTVNLAPADIKKIGPAYDLPIALGLLIASEQFVRRRAARLAGGGRVGAGWQRAACARCFAYDSVCAQQKLQTLLCAGFGC